MNLKRLSIEDKEAIKVLFTNVFTGEPWNDDWSDSKQLDLYIEDLCGQSYSLTYGLYDGNELIGLSMILTCKNYKLSKEEPQERTSKKPT